MNDLNYYVNENAIIDENVKIGDKTRIWHFSHIQSGSTLGVNCSVGQNVNIGNNVKIQNNVSVYEGVELEDYVFCGPSMVFTNILLPRCEFPQKGSKFYQKTLVKKSASIGANATIVCGTKIGAYALIGAGTVITKDVPDFALMVGNPGKIIGWVNKKGTRLEFDHQGKSECGEYLIHENIVKYLDR